MSETPSCSGITQELVFSKLASWRRVPTAQPRAHKGTQIASSGRRAFPNARRFLGGRLATQAAMNASSRSCRLPGTVTFSLASSFCGSHPCGRIQQ